MRLLILFASALLLAGCGTMPAPSTVSAPSAEDAAILEAVKALRVDPADKAVLSCTVEMVQGGYFRKYAWAPSQNGAAVAYNVEVAFVSADTVCLVIPGDETGLMVRAQGIGATGTVGPWSEWSEVVEVVK